jgi:hypothetical protein
MNRRSFIKSALPLASMLACSPLNVTSAQPQPKKKVEGIELTSLRLKEFSHGYVPRQMQLIGFGRSGKRIIKAFENKHRYGISDIEYAPEIGDDHIEDLLSYEPVELISRTLPVNATDSEFSRHLLYNNEKIDSPDTTILIGNMASIEEINLLMRTSEMARENNIFTIGIVSLPANQHNNWRSTELQTLSHFERSLDSLLTVPNSGHYQAGTTKIQKVVENLIHWYLASRHRYFCSFDLVDIKSVLRGEKAEYFHYELQENTYSPKDHTDTDVFNLSDVKGGLVHFRYNNYHNSRRLSADQIFNQIEQVVEVVDDNGTWLFDNGDWLFCFTEDRDCQEPCGISIIPVG